MGRRYKIHLKNKTVIKYIGTYMNFIGVGIKYFREKL